MTYFPLYKYHCRKCNLFFQTKYHKCPNCGAKMESTVKTIRYDGRCFFTAEEVLQIIDKYKAESEGENGNDNNKV